MYGHVERTDYVKEQTLQEAKEWIRQGGKGRDILKKIWIERIQNAIKMKNLKGDNRKEQTKQKMGTRRLTTLKQVLNRSTPLSNSCMVNLLLGYHIRRQHYSKYH